MEGQLSLFEEPQEAPVIPPTNYPKFVMYRNEMHRVLYYEGEGMFRLLDKGDRQMSAHRDRLSFLRPKKEK